MVRTTRLLIAAIFAFTPASLPAQEKAAPPQWIVVTAPAFREALTPLCDQRRAEGMHVVILQTTDVLTPNCESLY